jgi:hypothetical protein
MKRNFILAVMALAVLLQVQCSATGAKSTNDVAGAKEQILGKTWTDGFLFYEVQYLKKGEKVETYFDDMEAKFDMLFFMGGSLHEGGDYMIVRLNSDGSMSLFDFEDKNLGAVEYKVIDGEEALFVPNRWNDKIDILKPLKEGEDLRGFIVKQMVNYDLAGEYEDGKGKKYVFYPDKTRTKGFAKTEYTFGEVNFDPINVIVFSEKETYRYMGSECCDYELTLTPVVYNEDEVSWDDVTDKPLINLRKTRWTPPANIDSGKYPGKYPYASTQLLMRSDLLYFNKNQLQIMRNEIFARYGLKFKSNELREYFGAQDWYKPQFDDVTDKLTEREKQNIKLITEAEKDEEFQPMYDSQG